MIMLLKSEDMIFHRGILLISILSTCEVNVKSFLVSHLVLTQGTRSNPGWHVIVHHIDAEAARKSGDRFPVSSSVLVPRAAKAAPLSRTESGKRRGRGWNLLRRLFFSSKAKALDPNARQQSQKRKRSCCHRCCTCCCHRKRLITRHNRTLQQTPSNRRPPRYFPQDSPGWPRKPETREAERRRRARMASEFLDLQHQERRRKRVHGMVLGDSSDDDTALDTLQDAMENGLDLPGPDLSSLPNPQLEINVPRPDVHVPTFNQPSNDPGCVCCCDEQCFQACCSGFGDCIACFFKGLCDCIWNVGCCGGCCDEGCCGVYLQCLCCFCQAGGDCPCPV